MPSLDDLLTHPTRSTTSSRGRGSTTLFLGELGLGTKASDPRVYEGLAAYIKANNLQQDIGHVLVNGGILPYIPTFYGVQNAREMMFLGNDEKKEVDTREQLKLEHVDKKTRAFIEKWVLHKITNVNQAVEHSRRALEPLAQTLEGSVWHYLLGEEDNKNTEALIELKVNEYVQSHEQIQRDKKQKERLESEIEHITQELTGLETQYTLARSLRNGINPRAKPKTVERYISTFLDTHKEEIARLDDTDRFLKLAKKSTRKDLTERVEALDNTIKEQRSTIRQKQRALKDVVHALSAQQREAEAQQFHLITKRRHIKPDQAEILRGQAKDEYNANIYAALPQLLHLYVHSGNEVDLVIDGAHINFAHAASIQSVAAGLSDVKRLKDKNKNLLREGSAVPDISVSAHGAGGFRMEAMPKGYETIEDYVDRETPDLCMNMQLPTMQDVHKLRELIKKRIKNVHTQRLLSGNYSAGAVFYTIKETGEHEVTFVSAQELIRLADIKEKIDSLEDKTQALALQDSLVYNKTTGSVITDVHFGSPNKEGRPSNYEVFDKSAAYLREHGLPDVLVINGDIVHGCLERHFGSNEQYYSKVPYDLAKEIAQVEGTPEERAKKIQEIALRAQSQIPITTVSKQLRETKRRLIPLAHEVLDNDGHVVITSGNHYNETSKFLDEATDIANLLDSHHLDNPKLVLFDAFGDKYGMGQTTLPGGKILYCSHGPVRGSDNTQGGLRQVQGAQREADIAVYGHVHHCGGGHGGNTFVVVGAGMQTWNPYLDRIGMEAGLRGIVNFAYDKDKEVFTWEYILDKTLEK